MASILGEIDLWRSQEMQLVQLMVPSEAAHDTVAALGSIGMLQFRDLNPEKSAFQRTYATQVKRCDEMGRKLRYLSEQVAKANMSSPAGVSGRAGVWDRNMTMDELEAKLDQLEREMIELNNNDERLQRTHAELGELQLLLEKAGQFFDSAQMLASEAANAPPSAEQTMNVPLLDSDRDDAGLGYVESGPKMARLGFVAGLIQQEKMVAFERLLFRATRGNVFVRSSDVGKVQDPSSGEPQDKAAFVVFFSGDRSKTKIMKICEAFGANRYPFPEEVARQRQMHAEVTARLRELYTTIEAGSMQRVSVLSGVTSNLDDWSMLVRKEKAIYHTLNKMNLDFTRKVLVAEAWVPMSSRQKVSEALRQAAESSQAQVTTVMQPLSMQHATPPTYFQTNKFTECFQTIVDAYGVANYREVNPTVFTLMTFPFLFAVMFGDFGHGILMLLFAAVLLWNEKAMSRSKLDDITSMLFGGRYCILLMALYSIYTGALYNEFFSIPMTLAGYSHFKCFANATETVPTGPDDLRACNEFGGTIKLYGAPYSFGVDPAWRGTKTELPYLNSLKMKMSIIIGVIHMNLGILQSLNNNNYFRDRLSTVCEFIPQMLFLNSLFGYLSFMIVYKWISGSTADLYHVLIAMFLTPGEVDAQAYLFDGQAAFQVFLITVAFVSVPWMLFPKPFILKKRHEQARHGGSYARTPSHDGDESAPLATGPSSSGDDHGHGEHFDFGEVMVHQMIHTIEFVLGAVSNTASYLRLWALSLAHSQLSAVFYDRVLMAGVQSDNVAAMIVAFFVWACATLGVLMVMESLSAFLHALRLHWVEFQNKFYRGTGWQFVPFSFATLASEETA
uniref:V-type proton ATPase subunit a n=1 Tax=Chlamydomonas euryale TaxID=1486919 RepID=A0A7R9Z4K4_9CHLO